MPELPEVELVARSLQGIISGRRIAASRLIRGRLAPDTAPDAFSEKISNCSVNFVHRRGKHILFDLDNGHTLITHLRMSGRFIFLSPDQEDPKFTHAVFYFDDGMRLVYQDQRHFGLMKIVETRDLYEAKELRKLAPEPFSNEFSLAYFRSALKTSRRCIKEFLLDQTKVTGLGNIYASEALFLARVNPGKSSNTISARKAVTLYEMIRQVLLEAIANISTAGINPENMDGSYFGDDGNESKWRVYDRENLPCPNCGSAIARLKQGGRSTYFCRKCQRR